MFTVQDTMLRIWRCHDWECVHVLSGHKEAITSVSIHPSGKLALSVSKDNTMKLWNLVQGTDLVT
jgi:protein MAK11